tara:strand:+ start:6093 stop:8165 length:2073 start_codon:yes stop_codon:yes gene_type:complete
MAIAFARVTYHSRSQGQSAIACAAYRSGEKIQDERTGIIHNYLNKTEVTYKEILLPVGSNSKYQDRTTLWNYVEAFETRKNSQVAKEIVIALPNNIEVSDDDRIALAKQFADKYFVSKGIVADICIHSKNNNPHAHILLTTRRLIGDKFSRTKARDLDPSVRFKKVQENDAWGEKWRDMQNQYFKDKGLNISVDDNGIISQAHIGPNIKNSSRFFSFFKFDHNEEIKNCNRDIVYNDSKIIINHLVSQKEYFTYNDLYSFIKKHADNSEDAKRIFIKTKLSSELVKTGVNHKNHDIFTSKSRLKLEDDMLALASKVHSKNNFSIRKRLIKKYCLKHNLSQEQTDAVYHITRDSNFSLVVGRAGTGKSYSLKAAKELWDRKGFKTYGISISGKASEELQKSSNINSRTIHSFLYCLNKNYMKLDKKSVVVMDEAGMTDLPSMFKVIDKVNSAKAKLVLVGDPQQLQPIGVGLPFESLIGSFDASEISTVRRQQVKWQQKATELLSRGKTEIALKKYRDKGLVDYSDKPIEAVLDKFVDVYNKTKEMPLVLTYTNKDVDHINIAVRDYLVKNKMLDDGVVINTFKGNKAFCVGEKIICLENNISSGVKNGTIGIIKKIDNKILYFKSNDKIFKIDFVKYNKFDYGYSVTIHKSQGLTINNSIFYNKTSLNKNLIYVALSRHRNNCIIANEKI